MKNLILFLISCTVFCSCGTLSYNTHPYYTTPTRPVVVHRPHYRKPHPPVRYFGPRNDFGHRKPPSKNNGYTHRKRRSW